MKASESAQSGTKGPLSSEQSGRLASLPKHLRDYDIDPETGCWIFRRRSPNGYATNSSVKGRKGNAYKLIWEHFNGHVPKGLELDHLCNNGRGGCVNPGHLKAVTHRENMLRPGSRSLTKALAEATHCVNGHEFTPENTIYPNKNRKGKVREHWRACKTCRQEAQRRWHQENRERARELQRRYEQSPKGKAVKAERQRRYREKKRAERLAS